MNIYIYLFIYVTLTVETLRCQQFTSTVDHCFETDMCLPHLPHLITKKLGSCQKAPLFAWTIGSVFASSSSGCESAIGALKSRRKPRQGVHASPSLISPFSPLLSRLTTKSKKKPCPVGLGFRTSSL